MSSASRSAASSISDLRSSALFLTACRHRKSILYREAAKREVSVGAMRHATFPCTPLGKPRISIGIAFRSGAVTTLAVSTVITGKGADWENDSTRHECDSHEAHHPLKFPHWPLRYP